MSARSLSGMRAWLYQRITALYMVFFIPFLIWNVFISPPDGFAQWQALMAQPVVNIAMALFIAMLLVHAWVGGRDIILDYVHPLWLRMAKLTGLALFLAGCGIWALRIIFQVSSL